MRRSVLFYVVAALTCVGGVIALGRGATVLAVLVFCLAGMALVLPEARRHAAAEAAEQAPLREYVRQWGWSDSSGQWLRPGGLFYMGVALPPARARSLEEAHARQRADESLVLSSPRPDPQDGNVTGLAAV